MIINGLKEEISKSKVDSCAKSGQRSKVCCEGNLVNGCVENM